LPDLDTEIEALLAAWKCGSEKARGKLVQKLYPELIRLASSRLRKFDNSVSLFTGDLLHEALLKIFKGSPENISDKPHLMALAATATRQVLLDELRRKRRQKRNVNQQTLISTNHDEAPQGAKGQMALDLEALHHALIRLAAIDPERAKMVEMRYFGGMTVEDIAAALGVSIATVKRKWAATRMWLMEAIENDSRLSGD